MQLHVLMCMHGYTDDNKIKMITQTVNFSYMFNTACTID